jgi:hypothetical protein
MAVAASLLLAFSAVAQPTDLKSLRLAVEDLQSTFNGCNAGGPQFAAQLAELEKLPPSATQKPDFTNRVAALRQQALLANPLLDFSKLLLVRRNASHFGLPQNWQGNCAIASTGYDNDLAVLSPVGSAGKLTPLFAPEGKRFVGDVDLHFDADRMLFSMPDDAGRKVVCGGSFHDRPERVTSTARVSYPSWQKVFNVGFHVLCEVTPSDSKELTQAQQ